MAIIDISPPLSAKTPVWPGDTPFRAERTWTISKDSPVNVSRLVMSTHTGAHADAPLHYDNAGDAIDVVDLSAYIGPCTVIQLINAAAITQKLVASALPDRVAPRILICTYEKQPQSWDSDFAAVDAKAIEWLASKGVQLIGVDTPSLDPETSKSMDAHKAVLKHDMRILEGLQLDHVAPGDYELIALPLKLEGLDASPVRAVLRTLS